MDEGVEDAEDWQFQPRGQRSFRRNAMCRINAVRKEPSSAC